MTFQLKVKPRAEEDIAFGRDFYQEIRPQLAIDYLLEIDRCFDLILSNPLRRSTAFKDIRRLHLKRFPYVISYIIEGDLVVVIAVTHNRRQSREWKTR